MTLRDNAQAAVRRGRRGDRQRVEDVVVDDRDQPSGRVRVRGLAGEHAYHGVLREYSQRTRGALHGLYCCAQARTERADPSLMLAAPKLIDVRPPTPAPGPGLGWAPPFFIGSTPPR